MASKQHGQNSGARPMKPIAWPELRERVRDVLRLVPLKERRPRRALALGGGGPAVGISVGFLCALERWNDTCEDHQKIDFPVWVGGSVGAWLAVLYHISEEAQFQSTGRSDRARKWIRRFFRDDASYEGFPAPTTFTPDLPEMIRAAVGFMMDPRLYASLVVPQNISQAYRELGSFLGDPSRWNPGDVNLLMLNAVMAPSPASRLLMSLLYKTEVKGLNKLWFDERYSIMQEVSSRLHHLQDAQCPQIYINAYNLEDRHLQVFSNRPECSQAAGTAVPVKPITTASLCAASALPFVMEPVVIDGKPHMEGALIDSFCIDVVHGLAADTKSQRSINEVWISQIVDHTQINPPRHLLDALNNLIMLYAGTTSQDDIAMFVNDYNYQQYLAHSVLSREGTAKSPGEVYVPRPIEVIRLPVQADTRHYWTFSNFDHSVDLSEKACWKVIEAYGRSLTKSVAPAHAVDVDDCGPMGLGTGLRRPSFDNLFQIPDSPVRPMVRS